MSQTPSQLRKVPIHILDDLSSKFIVNLVSIFFIFFVFFFFNFNASLFRFSSSAKIYLLFNK